MIHDVRIIPLDGRPHISSAIRLWMGDSVGHWEGDTLVVDTTNFTDKTHFHGSDRNLHVIERFTLTGPDTLRYRFTIDDPTAFTRTWTGEIIMSRARRTPLRVCLSRNELLAPGYTRRRSRRRKTSRPRWLREVSIFHAPRELFTGSGVNLHERLNREHRAYRPQRFTL